MLEILEFMAAPAAAGLILVGIHGYLGLHVLKRQVIFVDLALAQIAALGAVIAFLGGHALGSWPAFTSSLAATLVGAAIFSLSRSREEKVPQEAIIGITYVIATAATILIADRAPEGAEHLHELLAGAILWVGWPKVIKSLLVYSAVGLFHYLVRHKLILISEDPERAYREGVRVRLWDFLFYASFGVVITLSVQIAGVLMVFAYLVAPAIIALAAARRWRTRVVVAWVVGVAATLLGLAASYAYDLPSGPAIVCMLGLFLVLYAAGRLVRRRLAA